MNLKEIGLLIEMQPTKQQIEELKGNITECQKKWLPADKLEASKEFDKEGFNQLHQLNQKYNHLSNQYKGLDKAFKELKEEFKENQQICNRISTLIKERDEVKNQLSKSVLIEDVEKILADKLRCSITNFKNKFLMCSIPECVNCSKRDEISQKLKSLKSNAKRIMPDEQKE